MELIISSSPADIMSPLWIPDAYHREVSSDRGTHTRVYSDYKHSTPLTFCFSFSPVPFTQLLPIVFRVICFLNWDSIRRQHLHASISPIGFGGEGRGRPRAYGERVKSSASNLSTESLAFNGFTYFHTLVVTFLWDSAGGYACIEVGTV